MKAVELLSQFLEKEFPNAGYTLNEVLEDEKNYYGYSHAETNYDVPVLIMNKATNKIDYEILPPFTDTSKAKTIWKKKLTNFKKTK